MYLISRISKLAKSSKILLLFLYFVSLLIFLLKVRYYHQQIDRGANGSEGTQDFSEILVPYLQLIPRYTIKFPWVLITATFAEIKIISFICSTITLEISSGYAERLWGAKEVVKFVLLIGTVTNFITALIAIATNIVRGDAEGMQRPLGGGLSYLSGFLVVLKQIIPEHSIVLFHGMINFRAKHIPFVFLLLMMVWSLIISRSLYPVVPSWTAFFTAYIYLRFFQSFATDTILPITTATSSSDASGPVLKGDASDTFRLCEFFPVISQPHLSKLFDKIYDLGCILGLISPFDEDSIEQSNLRAQKRGERVSQAQKSVANLVAERRRQVALQMIEGRINKESIK